MRKEEIVALLDADMYAIESEDARQAARYLADRENAFAYYDSDLPDRINQLIWSDASRLSEEERLLLAFDIYSDLPCVDLLQPMVDRYAQFSDSLKHRFWQQIRLLLSQEDDAPAGPICYVLWDDFLRPDSGGDEAWSYLVSDQVSPHLLKRILRCSAFAPFHLKEALYRRLMPNPSWHTAIYDNVLDTFLSTRDMMSKEQVRGILSQLDIPSNTPYLKTLRKLLG